MSRFPTDPDDDDIKRILETMWEKTSHDGPDEMRSFTRSKPINIEFEHDRNGLKHVAARLPRRRLIDALHDIAPEDQEGPAPSNSHDPLEPSAVNYPASSSTDDAGDSQSGPHTGDRNQPLPNSPETADQRLSALSYQGGGQEAASKTAMQTQSPQNPDEAKIDHANGHAHEEPSEAQADNQSGSAKTQTPDKSSAGPDPENTAKPEQKTGGRAVKREMASFFDKRMMHMSDELLTPETTSAPAQSQSQPQPQPPAPTAAAPSTEVVQPSAPVAQPTTHQQPGQDSSNESAAELMRPVLRQWLGENMPKIVESALQIEAAEQASPGDTKKPDK